MIRSYLTLRRQNIKAELVHLNLELEYIEKELKKLDGVD